MCTYSVILKYISTILLFYASLVNSYKCDQTDSNLKLIIDNDAGGDDAMGIFLALLFEKKYNGPKLVGLTTTNGNTNEDNVYRNNQIVLNIAKRTDIPIHRGSKKSLVSASPSGSFYGSDGLGDANITINGELVPADNHSAVQALIAASKLYEGQLVVVTLGPVTNLALAIRMDPDFLGRLKHLYVAAGHLHEEEKKEFNARTDVEAYQIIADEATPDKVTMFPYSQAIESASYSKSWRMNVLGEIDTDIMKALNKFERISINNTRYDTWHALDATAVAIVVCPDLIESMKTYKNSIISCGPNRGINVNHENVNGNAQLIYSIKTKDYQDFLMEVFQENETQFCERTVPSDTGSD